MSLRIGVGWVVEDLSILMSYVTCPAGTHTEKEACVQQTPPPSSRLPLEGGEGRILHLAAIKALAFSDRSDAAVTSVNQRAGGE